MASSADNLVRDAIKAYHSGDVSGARNLLLQAVEVDEASEQAWLWLSAVVETDHDRQTCLENVLTINPNNEKAKQGLRILKDKANTGSPPLSQASSSISDDDPFANVSFTEHAGSAETISPFAADSDEDEEELPDVAWGSIETSSASAQAKIPEVSPNEYEDWISGLNIGGNEAQETFGDVPEEMDGDLGYNAAPFIGSDDAFDVDTPFDLDDSIFGLDDEAFSVSDDLDAVGSPFSADIDSDDAEDAAPSSPPPAATPSSAAPRSSPVPASQPQRTISSPVPARSEPAAFGILDDNFSFDFDDTGIESLDPEEYFAYIPNEIKATRMPGTNERYSPLLIIGLILLFALNLGAVFLVFSTLNAA